jgi:hypothetical protein
MTFSTGCLDIRHRLPDTKVEEVLTRRERRAGCLGVSTPRNGACHSVSIIPDSEQTCKTVTPASSFTFEQSRIPQAEMHELRVYNPKLSLTATAISCSEPR